MEEQFELPVKYKGEQLMLNASLIITGYTYKFSVDVKGQIIVFELDEERNYRAIIPYEDVPNSKNVDVELIKSVASSIEQLVK